MGVMVMAFLLLVRTPAIIRSRCSASMLLLPLCVLGLTPVLLSVFLVSGATFLRVLPDLLHRLAGGLLL